MFSGFSIFPQKQREFTKIPKKVFILSTFGEISQNELDYLSKKYKINTILAPKPSKDDKFFFHKNFKVEEVPDLIILCHSKLEFNLEEPEILYKAEIIHSRKAFSKELFEYAINHYSNTVINSGR